MSLNIFPREKKVPPPLPEYPPVVAVENAVPSPESTASAESLDDPKKRTRRGSRGGRGRGKARTGAVGEVLEEEASEAEPLIPVVTEPGELSRSPRRRRPKAEAEAEAATEAPAVTVVAPPTVTGGRRKPAAISDTADAPVARRSRPKPAPIEVDGRPTTPLSDAGAASVLRAIDIQSRQMEHLIQLQEDMAKRIGSGANVAAPPLRVGVFVDAANVELAIDRLRTRLDWGKILKVLTEGRQLVRAMAYSPIHDDPSVSMETQRFVEPFLDKGYKIVTKPLKRFQDGTIKANVDIELALDIITMLDRLDIVCLVSGDGDFQRLVEVVQSRGVRVEVVGVGTSVAGNLRNAADAFIDLATRTRELKL